jgi:DnaD/phage-associated family protein
MAIVRTRKRENPFVQIDKRFIERDEALSWKAKGIQTYLLSRPDGWEIKFADLVKRAKDSRDGLATGLQELEAAGYISKSQEREGGKFGQVTYTVYERPEFNPNWIGTAATGKTVSGKTATGKTASGKSDTINNKGINNELNNNELNNKAAKNTTGQLELQPLTGEIFTFFDENLKRLTPYYRERVNDWLKDHSPELVLHVFKHSLDVTSSSGGTPLKLIDKIFKRTREMGIETVKDFLEAERQHEKGKTPTGKRITRREKLPEWYEEHQKGKQPPPDLLDEDFIRERDKLQKELKEFRKAANND